MTTNGKLNRGIFGSDSQAIESLLALKKIKDYCEWENRIMKAYGLSLVDFDRLITKVQNYHIYNFSRLLSKPEDDKILFYNVSIRGKGY